MRGSKNLLPPPHTHPIPPHTHLAVVLPHEGEEMHASNMEHVHGPVILARYWNLVTEYIRQHGSAVYVGMAMVVCML